LTPGERLLHGAETARQVGEFDGFEAGLGVAGEGGETREIEVGRGEGRQLGFEELHEVLGGHRRALRRVLMCCAGVGGDFLQWMLVID